MFFNRHDHGLYSPFGDFYSGWRTLAYIVCCSRTPVSVSHRSSPTSSPFATESSMADTPNLLVHATYRLKPEDVEAFRSLGSRMTAAASARDGCAFLNVAQDIDGPATFRLSSRQPSPSRPRRARRQRRVSGHPKGGYDAWRLGAHHRYLPGVGEEDSRHAFVTIPASAAQDHA